MFHLPTLIHDRLDAVLEKLSLVVGYCYNRDFHVRALLPSYDCRSNEASLAAACFQGANGAGPSPAMCLNTAIMYSAIAFPRKESRVRTAARLAKVILCAS